MKYKEFSQLEKGDSLFILIDQYGLLSRNMSNPNYGLIIESREVSRCNKSFFPRSENGRLIEIEIGKPIVKVYEAVYIEHYYINGKQVPTTIPETKETLFRGTTIVKKEGSESHVVRKYEYVYNDYRDIHIFTTKEELEAYVKEELETIENNLKKIHKTLNELH